MQILPQLVAVVGFFGSCGRLDAVPGTIASLHHGLSNAFQNTSGVYDQGTVPEVKASDPEGGP